MLQMRGRDKLISVFPTLGSTPYLCSPRNELIRDNVLVSSPRPCHLGVEVWEKWEIKLRK